MKQYRKKIAQPKAAMGQKRARFISNLVIYIILVIMMIIWLIPFACIFLESFRTHPTELGNCGHLISNYGAEGFGFDNYVNLFKNTNFGRWYLNTAITAVFTAVFQTIFVLAMSYTLSRLRFKGRKFLMNFMLILGMFPGFLSMILLFKILSWWGFIKDLSIIGLVIVYCASSGMGYYVSKGYFDTIPRSLDEAARVDGANRFQVFWKIIIPLSKPIVIYTILTAFMAPWGDFIFAKFVAAGTDSGRNVATGMQYMISKDNIGSQYTMFCAASVLVAVPVTTLFMFLQRYYVEGVTGGAVKG